MPYDTFKVRYQIGPIILTGGLASQVSGGMVPIINLLAANFNVAGSAAVGANLINLLSQANPQVGGSFAGQNVGGIAAAAQAQIPTITNYDEAFGAFNVLPGGSLINQTIPKYPLADFTMASNAIVRDPNTISLMWETPMRGPSAWNVKQTTFTALKMLLERHNNAGGLYIVQTPAYIYTNCVMTSLTDNSRAENPLPQNAWRFDFERPMVMTDAEAGSDQSALMAKLSAGVQSPVTTSAPQTGSLGGNPATTPGVIPALPAANAGTSPAIPFLSATLPVTPLINVFSQTMATPQVVQ